MYNIMTCENLGTSILGNCSLSWFAIAFIFFVSLVLRRQCSDGLLSGTRFNFIGALVVGLGISVLLVTLFGDPKWVFIGGLIGDVVGGFGGGMIYDTSESGE